LKKKLRESVQCADWDLTLTEEEKKMIKDVDENVDFELKMLPGDNSSKKTGQNSDKDEKCLDRKDKKMEYVIKYIDKFKWISFFFKSSLNKFLFVKLSKLFEIIFAVFFLSFEFVVKCFHSVLQLS